MAAGVYNISLEQGATYRQHILWRQPSADPTATLPPPGDPNDLTGCTAEMQIRSRRGGTLFCQVDTTDGITLGGADGTIDIVITAAKTTLVTHASALYDLIIVFPGGDVVRLLEGTVTTDLRVTVPNG